MIYGVRESMAYIALRTKDDERANTYLESPNGLKQGEVAILDQLPGSQGYETILAIEHHKNGDKTARGFSLLAAA